MSATTRTVLDQIRVILIWAVFLIPWVSAIVNSVITGSSILFVYFQNKVTDPSDFLCAVQDYFHWTAVGYKKEPRMNLCEDLQSRFHI